MNSVRIAMVTIVLFFIGFLVLGLEKSEKPVGVCPKCNVVVISLTNTRKDHLGLYGYEKNITPNIDQYFSDAIRFDSVFSPTSWTLPNAVTLFTGLSPSTHKVSDRLGDKQLSVDVPTIASILSANGYLTAAFTGGGDYDHAYGFQKGFSEYHDEKSFSGIADSVDEIINWLEKNRRQRFFLFVQGFDTHCPFTSPETIPGVASARSIVDGSLCYFNTVDESFRNKEAGSGAVYTVYQSSAEGLPEKKHLNELEREALVTLYNNEISHADQALGRLFSVFERHNLSEDTIVIFMSEHGDLLGENGRFMRTDIRGSLVDAVINIPFLIRIPHYEERKSISDLVSLEDIFPTLMTLLGIGENVPESVEGADMSSLMTTESELEKKDFVFGRMEYTGSSEHPYFKNKYAVSMVRSQREKLVLEQEFELATGVELGRSYLVCDLVNDPYEERCSVAISSSNAEMQEMLLGQSD